MQQKLRLEWDWNPLWHIVTNDECLPTTHSPKLPWLHFVHEAIFFSSNLLWKNTPF